MKLECGGLSWSWLAAGVDAKHKVEVGESLDGVGVGRLRIEMKFEFDAVPIKCVEVGRAAVALKL